MKIIPAFFLFLLLSTFSFATAPTSISLSYDLDKGILHVEAAHPTQNLWKNFIRLMKVYVNGEEAGSFNYARQQEYDKFTDDVSVTAKVGDTIKVDLYSAEGGTGSQEMTVKEPGASNQNPDNSTTNAAINAS